MKEQDTTQKIFPALDWSTIDTVLLDMDGTLLDRHFDDYFWEQYLPEHYSLQHDISIEQAREELLRQYRSVANTLDWADINYWSRQLGLDIPSLKLRINHLISVHPYVIQFLESCLAARKNLYLLTNAHTGTLEIKLEKTTLGAWFDRIICAEEVGFAKEQPAFWPRLESILALDKQRCLLVDDTEAVLHAARDYGIAQLIFVARPSSRQPVRYAKDFPSIEYFKEIMPA